VPGEARNVPLARGWHLVRGASTRLSWGIADQCMSSLTNFLLSSLIARSLGASQFGAFTLAYVTYGWANNASRGISIEPLLIRFSGTSLPVWRRAAAGCTGTALIVGLICGACALGIAPLVGGTTRQAFLALGLTFPGLLLQDSWRYSFFALGRGYAAFINDTVWALIQIPALLILKATGHADVFWFTLAWGGGATVGAVVGLLQAKVVPSLFGAWAWVKAHRDLGPRYLIENTASNSADIGRTYGLTSILGLGAVGYIAGANVLMGPFRIILFGVGLITIPEGARILRRMPRRLPLYCIAVTIGLTGAALAWGVLLLIAMPHGLGHLTLGTIWRPTYPLVLPTTLAIMANCASTGANIGLHTLGASRRSMRAVLVSNGIFVAAALGGAVVDGMIGSLSGAAVAAWIGTAVSWRELRQALLESDRVGVPFWLFPLSAGRHAAPSARFAAHRRAGRVLRGQAPVGAPGLRGSQAQGGLNRSAYRPNSARSSAKS
jgi:O-antigen/teichoic acid export membrane protein